jgi:hypothetical protein
MYNLKVEAYNTLISQVQRLRRELAHIGTAAGVLDAESGIVDVANGVICAMVRLENELSLLAWQEAARHRRTGDDPQWHERKSEHA